MEIQEAIEVESNMAETGYNETDEERAERPGEGEAEAVHRSGLPNVVLLVRQGIRIPKVLLQGHQIQGLGQRRHAPDLPELHQTLL